MCNGETKVKRVASCPTGLVACLALVTAGCVLRTIEERCERAPQHCGTDEEQMAPQVPSEAPWWDPEAVAGALETEPQQPGGALEPLRPEEPVPSAEPRLPRRWTPAELVANGDGEQDPQQAERPWKGTGEACGSDGDCQLYGPEHSEVACLQRECHWRCAPGYADCDEDPSNGCEVYLPGDVRHCGVCGNDCTEQAPEGAAAVCQRGNCAWW